MSTLFYISGAIAVISGLMVITRTVAMHALMNLVVTFVALACVFWTLGAPFAAVLQIVVYAGAIMVLFVFAVMILNLAPQQRAMRPSMLGMIAPAILAAVLLAEFILVLISSARTRALAVVGPVPVGENLFTVYALGVEIASVMLLAGLVAAFHYGARPDRVEGRND